MIMLETAPLIEDSGFVPAVPSAQMALLAAGDGALEAALRRFGASDAPAAAEARGELLFDLFVDARSGYRAEGAGRSAEDILATTSWRGWLMGEDAGGVSPELDGRGMKDTALRAAFEDVDGDGKEDEPIVVKGDRKVDDGSGGDTGGGYGDGSYPGGPTGPTPGDGGGGLEAPNQKTEDAKDTPCVDEVPANVDKEHLNDLAKFMGNVLAGKQDATGHEWGAFIYRTPDGQLYQSEPFTAGRFDSMDGAVATGIPGNAIIVGYLHTHPVDDLMDERNLSDDDRDFIRNLIDSGRADPNMLAYVVTKDEESRYFNYVYDRSKRNSDMPGCDL
jgi:hypothetical protein